MLDMIAVPLPAVSDDTLGGAFRVGNMLVEIGIFAALIYAALKFLWETRGSVILRGLGLLLAGLLLAFYVLVNQFGLERLQYVLDGLAPSAVVGLIVVFQPEIRRGILQLGDASLFRRFFRRDIKIVPRLLRAIARLSKERIGALIAIERDSTLGELTDNGITIDAELNSYLIESIFYPKSALHDGGVVVRDDRIVAASCLFPLSQNPEVDKRLGTRHRAALGLAEETDAFVLVVSEETGKISTASGGRLNFDLTLEQVEQQLEAALGRRRAS